MSVTKSNWQFKTLAMWKLLRTDEFALSTFLDFVTCTVINQMFIRRQFHADYDYILWWICPDKLATINTHAIWYNWIRIWQSNPQTYRVSLISFLYTYSTTLTPVSHLPNIYSFFCSGIWCPLVDADSVSWSSEPNHTCSTIFLPASVFLLQRFKKKIMDCSIQVALRKHFLQGRQPQLLNWFWHLLL